MKQQEATPAGYRASPETPQIAQAIEEAQAAPCGKRPLAAK